MRISRLFLIYLLFLILHLGLGTGRASAQQDTTLVARLLDEGINEMKRGSYYDADLIFRKIMGLEAVIPDEFCYYYGETLLQLKRYRLSQSFLEKYEELTEGQGPFHTQTQASLVIAKSKIREIEACDDCDDDGYKVKMAECHICGGDGKLSGPCTRCSGRGNEVCPTCRGEGIEILRTSFGRRYVPCSNCQEMGTVTCKKCQGSKVEYHLCDACRGVGMLETRERYID